MTNVYHSPHFPSKSIKEITIPFLPPEPGTKKIINLEVKARGTGVFSVGSKERAKFEI